MKTINIRHKPWWGQWLVLTIFLIMLSSSAFSITCLQGDAMIIVSCIILAVSFSFVIIGSFIVKESETEVNFGEGSVINCQWMFYKWSIDMEQVKSVNYTVTAHRSKYTKWHTLDLIFVYKSEKVKSLTAKIDDDEINKCIMENTEELPIMRIYEFIQFAYPEKAEGYKEN